VAWTIRAEVVAAAEAADVPLTVLSDDETQALRAAVEERFADGSEAPYLFDRLREAVFARIDEGWRMLAGFDAASPALVLTDDDEPAFELRSPADFVRVYDETPAFDFYVVDRELGSLVGFNHHDFLFAAGAAEAWLDGLGLDVVRPS